MRCSIHVIEEECEWYENPIDVKEHERRVSTLQRQQGFTVIFDVDTTDNPRLDDMRFTVLSRTRKGITCTS